MQVYEFGKTPINIVDMEVVEIQKSEIPDEEKNSLIIRLTENPR